MIRNEKSLITLGLIVSCFFLIVLTILFITSIISYLLFNSILFGALLSLFNFTIGFLLIIFGIKRSEKIFLAILWGGLIFRLITSLSLVIITLIFLEINTYGFIFSILFFYIFYLIIEIIYLDLRRKSQFDGK